MLYKKCYDVLNTKILLCSIRRNGFVIKTVLKKENDKVIDLISDEVIELSSDNLLSFETRGDGELEKFVFDVKLKLDFLHKLLKEKVSFNLNYYYLSVDKVEFFKNEFGGNVTDMRKFKINLIMGFCDELYSQIKDSTGCDIDNILNSINQLKSYDLEDLQSIEELTVYWPLLLKPDPFNI